VGQAVRLCERLAVEVVWAAEGTAARAPAVMIEESTLAISIPFLLMDFYPDSKGTRRVIDYATQLNPLRSLIYTGLSAKNWRVTQIHAGIG
jgi:hypothetical protein